jgi:hypothetical protein
MTFTPQNHRFVRLAGFKLGGTIDVYEYANHAVVDGRADILRLNIYLCRDGAFVNVWNGLIEPMFAEARFELSGAAGELDFQPMYSETLFRGYLETDAEAAVVLRTLRISAASLALPQVLRGAPSDLKCEFL